MTRAPLGLLGAFVALLIVAPALAPYGVSQRFDGYAHAPPMGVRLDGGGLYAVPVRLIDRLLQQYEPIAGGRAPLPWSPAASDPVFLLGADALGRDVLSQTLLGARPSLGLALLATLGTLAIGALLGAWAGMAGGRVEAAIEKGGDVLLVLPMVYAVVALRAALPLVLPLGVVVASLTGIFVLLGWPRVARGVRAIVRVEASREHVLAAVALGASRWRVLTRHLLPACAGFLAVQTALLVPAFVLTESTLSYVGLGFPDGVPSWGRALADAAQISSLTRAPWTLAPAGAIFLVVLATNLLLDPASDDAPRG
jgi:ABC-type dipeptide/oligopeptide/nickel transport system permease subunit